MTAWRHGVPPSPPLSQAAGTQAPAVQELRLQVLRFFVPVAQLRVSII